MATIDCQSVASATDVSSAMGIEMWFRGDLGMCLRAGSRAGVPTLVGEWVGFGLPAEAAKAAFLASPPVRCLRCVILLNNLPLPSQHLLIAGNLSCPVARTSRKSC